MFFQGVDERSPDFLDRSHSPCYVFLTELNLSHLHGDTVHIFRFGTRVKQYDPHLGCSCYRERDNIGHQSLQKTHTRWQISQR